MVWSMFICAVLAVFGMCCVLAVFVMCCVLAVFDMCCDGSGGHVRPLSCVVRGHRLACACPWQLPFSFMCCPCYMTFSFDIKV
jgi:hypothetical protein